MILLIFVVCLLRSIQTPGPKGRHLKSKSGVSSVKKHTLAIYSLIFFIFLHININSYFSGHFLVNI